MYKIEIIKYGEQCVLLRWPQIISAAIHDEILEFEAILIQQYKAELLDIVVTYCELAMFLKPGIDPDKIISEIKPAEIEKQRVKIKKRVIWEIPVCYDPTFGWDIEFVAQQHQLTIREVQQLHTAQPYRIYFTGFLPGFLYLGGLPDKIASPRRTNPRVEIPSGSVGIGGKQTGIYPTTSPGGWHIIGNTPIKLFDKYTHPPSVFSAGDFVQFRAITIEQYERIKHDVILHQYELKQCQKP